MKKILHVIANPKQEGSVCRDVSDKMVEEIKRQYPEYEIETLDLYKTDIEHLSLDTLNRKNTKMIDMATHFASFDVYIFTSPMWNLFFPSILKSYLDHVICAGICFRYNKFGIPRGILKNKKAICVLSRGGTYGFWPLSIFANDKKYLRQILRYTGIKDISFITADGIDQFPEKRDKITQNTIKKALKLVKTIK